MINRDRPALLLTGAPSLYGVTVATKFSATVKSPNFWTISSNSSGVGVNCHLQGRRERERERERESTIQLIQP